MGRHDNKDRPVRQIGCVATLMPRPRDAAASRRDALPGSGDAHCHQCPVCIVKCKQHYDTGEVFAPNNEDPSESIGFSQRRRFSRCS